MSIQKHFPPYCHQNKQKNLKDFTEDEWKEIMESLDHVLVVTHYREVGSCTLCKKISLKKCSNCEVLYCSLECQNVDFMNHKEICYKSRFEAQHKNSSVKLNKQFHSTSIDSDSQCITESLMVNDGSSPFQALANQLNKKEKFQAEKPSKTVENTNEDYLKKNKKLQSTNESTSKGYEVKNRFSFDKKDVKKFSIEGSKKDFAKKPVDNLRKLSSNEQSRVFPFEKSIKKENEVEQKEIFRQTESTPKAGSASSRKPVKNQKESESNEEWNQLENTSKSSFRKFIKSSKERIEQNGFLKGVENNSQKSFKSVEKEAFQVMCTHRESKNRHWVIDEDNLTKYDDIQSTLAKNCPYYETIKVKTNFLVGCNFDGEWLRGKVVKMNSKISVRFIDNGKNYDYEYSSMKKLPFEMRSLPGLARLIEFEEGTPSPYLNENLSFIKLTVQEIKRINNIALVRIIDGPFGKSMVGSSESKTEPPIKKVHNIDKWVMDDLTENSSGTIFFESGKEDFAFGSIVPDNDDEALRAVYSVANFNFNELNYFEAKEGSYVLVPAKEQRGKVLFKLGPIYYVQLIDSGLIIDVDSVCPLHDEFKDLKKLGTRITFKDIVSLEKLNEFPSASFCVTGQQKPGKWLCTLKSSTDKKLLANAVLEKPLESIEQNPMYVSLESGCQVEITALPSPNEVFIRPFTSDVRNTIDHMNHEMSCYATRAFSFKYIPPIHTLCCAKYAEDECFYRARIISTQGDEIKVVFVDFGNTQTTHLNDLKPIPESLKVIPFLAVKVTLSNVKAKKLSKLALNYLEKLIDLGTRLILTFENSIDGGVTLIEKQSNQIVNEVIQQNNVVKGDSTPSNSTNLGVTAKEKIIYSSLHVNEKCDLILLHFNRSDFETSYSFWVTNAIDPNAIYVLNNLNSKISKYCSTTSIPYRPKVQEACFAEFEGNWYRALTLSIKEDDFVVFFLDFGNIETVKANSIRKIKKEYLNNPVLAIKCVLHGFERLKGKVDLRRRVCEFLESLTNSVISEAEVNSFENELYHVTIPEIEDLISQ